MLRLSPSLSAFLLLTIASSSCLAQCPPAKRIWNRGIKVRNYSYRANTSCTSRISNSCCTKRVQPASRCVVSHSAPRADCANARVHLTPTIVSHSPCGPTALAASPCNPGVCGIRQMNPTYLRLPDGRLVPSSPFSLSGYVHPWTRPGPDVVGPPGVDSRPCEASFLACCQGGGTECIDAYMDCVNDTGEPPQHSACPNEPPEI